MIQTLYGCIHTLKAPVYTLETIKLKLVTFLLPEACLEGLEKLVEVGLCPSRRAAIRLAVRDLLQRELWRPERMAVKEEGATKKGRVRRPHATITLK